MSKPKSLTKEKDSKFIKFGGIAPVVNKSTPRKKGSSNAFTERDLESSVQVTRKQKKNAGAQQPVFHGKRASTLCDESYFILDDLKGKVELLEEPTMRQLVLYTRVAWSKELRSLAATPHISNVYGPAIKYPSVFTEASFLTRLRDDLRTHDFVWSRDFPKEDHSKPTQDFLRKYHAVSIATHRDAKIAAAAQLKLQRLAKLPPHPVVKSSLNGSNGEVTGTDDMDAVEQQFAIYSGHPWDRALARAALEFVRRERFTMRCEPRTWFLIKARCEAMDFHFFLQLGATTLGLSVIHETLIDYTLEGDSHQTRSLYWDPVRRTIVVTSFRSHSFLNGANGEATGTDDHTIFTSIYWIWIVCNWFFDFSWISIMCIGLGYGSFWIRFLLFLAYARYFEPISTWVMWCVISEVSTVLIFAAIIYRIEAATHVIQFIVHHVHFQIYKTQFSRHFWIILILILLTVLDIPALTRPVMPPPHLVDDYHFVSSQLNGCCGSWTNSDDTFDSTRKRNAQLRKNGSRVDSESGCDMTTRKPGKCYACGSRDHIARDCDQECKSEITVPSSPPPKVEEKEKEVPVVLTKKVYRVYRVIPQQLSTLLFYLYIYRYFWALITNFCQFKRPSQILNCCAFLWYLSGWEPTYQAGRRFFLWHFNRLSGPLYVDSPVDGLSPALSLTPITWWYWDWYVMPALYTSKYNTYEDRPCNEEAMRVFLHQYWSRNYSDSLCAAIGGEIANSKRYSPHMDSGEIAFAAFYIAQQIKSLRFNSRLGGLGTPYGLTLDH